MSGNQETYISGILQQTIPGTQTLEKVETSDRFKFFKQSFECTNFQNRNSRIYQEVDSKGEWVTSIDVTDTYFHVPIHPQSQKYLRFQTKKGVFQFRALPFGVATAPLEFTRIVKAVKLIAQDWILRIH